MPCFGTGDSPNACGWHCRPGQEGHPILGRRRLTTCGVSSWNLASARTGRRSKVLLADHARVCRTLIAVCSRAWSRSMNKDPRRPRPRPISDFSTHCRRLARIVARLKSNKSGQQVHHFMGACSIKHYRLPFTRRSHRIWVGGRAARSPLRRCPSAPSAPIKAEGAGDALRPLSQRPRNATGHRRPLLAFADSAIAGTGLRCSPRGTCRL